MLFLLTSVVVTTGWLVALASGASTTSTLVATLAAAAAFSALALRARIPQKLTAAAGIALLALAVVIPPQGSGDVWSYVMYGRTVAVHDANPYVSPPNAFTDDPLARNVQPGWAHVETVYGPAFTALSAAGADLAGDSPVTNRLFHQGLAALAIAAVALAFAIQQRNSRPIVLLTLNPAVLAMVNGGHNDLLVGALLAAGLWFARKHIRLCVLAITAALLVKATAGIAAFTFLTRRRREQALQYAALLAVVVVCAYAPFGGLDAVRPLIAQGGGTSRASLWSLPTAIFGTGTWLLVAWLACIGATLWLTRKHTVVPATAITLVVAIFTAPYVLPWYCAWALPLAIIAGGRVAVVATVQSLALFVAYAVPPGVAIDNAVIGAISASVLPLTAIAISVWLLRWPQRPYLSTAGSPPSSADEATASRCVPSSPVHP